jgi:hypothetical protein
MRPSDIGAIVFAATVVSLGLWSAVALKTRAGPLLGRFFTSRKEIGRLLAKGATSPWDPFGPSGHRRWRAILFLEFGIFIVLNVFTR